MVYMKRTRVCEAQRRHRIQSFAQKCNVRNHLAIIVQHFVNTGVALAIEPRHITVISLPVMTKAFSQLRVWILQRLDLKASYIIVLCESLSQFYPIQKMHQTPPFFFGRVHLDYTLRQSYGISSTNSATMFWYFATELDSLCLEKTPEEHPRPNVS